MASSVTELSEHRRSFARYQSGSAAIQFQPDEREGAFIESQAIGKNLTLFETIQELMTLVMENTEDEEQSRADSESIIQSINFLINFAFDRFRKPDLLIEPDGCIAFEWESYDGEQSFIVSFSGQDDIHYAGIFGHFGECHGKETYNSMEIPEVLYFNISRIN